MADVRCPMCGKPNPAEAEICRHCQARLKPLSPKPPAGNAAGSSSVTQPTAAPQNSGEATDWLRGLMDASGAPEESGPVEPAQPAEDSPDWLSRIRQRSQEEQDALSKIGPKPQVEGSTASEADWLNEISEPENGSTSGGSDVSAWLASLRDSDEPKPAAPPASPGRTSANTQPPAASPARKLEKDDDDWLRSLTTRIQASQSLDDQLSQINKNQPESISQQPPAEPAASADDLPDWLRDLEQPQAPTPVEPPAAASDAAESEGLPDWLKELQPKVEPPVEPASQTAAEDLPDWLHDFQEPAAAVPAPQEPEPAQPANFPAWMNELQIEEPPANSPAEPAQPAASAGDMPDWMRDFQAAAPDADVPQTKPISLESSEEALPAEELPDWLHDFQAETPASAVERPINALPSMETPAAPAENLPDWLREMQGAPQAPDAAQPEQAGEDLPDWLNDFKSLQLPGASPAVEVSTPEMPAAEIEPVSADSTSEWLSNFGAPAAEAPTAPAAEEVPDWLRDFNQTGAQAEEPVETTSAEPAAAPAEIPDWLRDFHKASASSSDAITPSEPSAQPPAVSQAPETPAAVPANETPDWLRDFGAAAADAPAQDWLSSLNEAPDTAARGANAALEGFSSDEALPAADIPDWLKSPASAETPARMSEPAAFESSAQGPVFGEEGLPDWMKSEPPAEGSAGAPYDRRTSSESAPPFASREMNEMLQGVSPEVQEGGRASAESEPETLEPAQLPTWLQAMRPVESAVSLNVGIDEQRVERSGPLAGLRGVLPGEELVANYRKPPVYTNKLQVSEKQHLNSVLLERILYDETQAQSVPGEPTRASQMITRILVAILLLVLVITPGLIGIKFTVPAALPAMQPGLGAMYKSINDLQPGANVLVVADFEAGLNGEMKSAAQAVLLHLQQRQPRVILTSTVPIGTLLGDMLLKDAKINTVANLGYLAGGSNVLRRLSVPASAALPNPLQQVVPYPYRRGWKDEMMQGIKELNSFQRILVLTDSVENARAWVEQVQPTLGSKTQLIMISSAQAAPLVRAYVESNQVQGLVSGLLGGAAYEQLMRQQGLAAASWTSYQLTLAAVIALIAAGALASGISNLIRRGKSKRKA